MILRLHVVAVTDTLALFVNPLVVILLLAAAVSVISGRLVDSLIIITVVLLGAAVNYFQTCRSQRAAERLRQQVAPSATVLRDGVWQEIHRHDVKMSFGLTAADLTPAGARLLESRDLYVQQATLTGESLPVQKAAGSGGTTNNSGLDAPEMVFLGSSVVSGTATALVLATGSRTVFGDIAERLALRPEGDGVRTLTSNFRVLHSSGSVLRRFGERRDAPRCV